MHSHHIQYQDFCLIKSINIKTDLKEYMRIIEIIKHLRNYILFIKRKSILINCNEKLRRTNLLVIHLTIISINIQMHHYNPRMKSLWHTEDELSTKHE